MKRMIIASLLTALILFPLFIITYQQGIHDGVRYYKRSRSFMLTLHSMYMYGYDDGKNGLPPMEVGE